MQERSYEHYRILENEAGVVSRALLSLGHYLASSNPGGTMTRCREIEGLAEIFSMLGERLDAAYSGKELVAIDPSKEKVVPISAAVIQ